MKKSLLQLICILLLIFLWVLNPIPFSPVSYEQSLNFGLIEKADIRLLQNEIRSLKLSPNRNIFDSPIYSFQSSIYDVQEISSKRKNFDFSSNRYPN